MAIDPSTDYAGQVDTPGATYPYGQPRNRSAPSSTDGTPLEEAWVADFWGFVQAVLGADGTAPSGSPETAQTSQIFDALRRVKSGFFWSVQSGAELEVHTGGLVTIESGATQSIEGTLDIDSGGTQEVNSGGFVNVNAGAEVNFKASSILDWESGSNANLLSGAQLRTYAGSTLQVDGEMLLGGATTVDAAATVTWDGASNYPLLSSRSEWVPCRGQTSFPSPEFWYDNYGAGWTVSGSSAQQAFRRVEVPDNFTISKVEVRWQGPSHPTWPPENRTTFSVYKVDFNGSKNLLVEQADTNSQVTYEANHALLLEFANTTFAPTEYLLIEMLTESGTNAVGGSTWVASQMLATFSQLKQQS